MRTLQTENIRMGADDKITQEDAASYLESDAYAKLPQAKKDEVIKFLKTNMVRGTMGTPDTAEDVARRRGQTGSTGSVIEGVEQADQPGVTGRLVKGGLRGLTGLATAPITVEQDITQPPTEYEKGRHLRHPFVFGEPERGVGLTLDRLFFDPQFSQFNKSRQAFKEGKTSEGLAHGAASLIPGAGPFAAGIGEDIGKGEWVEALGENAVYAIAGLATKRMMKGVEPSKRLSAAAGGGAKEFESVMRDLATSAKKYGKPKTVNDLYELVKKTGRDMETDFNQALQPIASQRIMPSEVATRLLQEANKFDAKTPEGRAARQYLRQRAIDYQKPWSLGDLNQKRMKMLDATLEAKTQVKQMGAVRNNVETLADKTIEDSLREIVYGEMDRRYKGAKFKELKEKQAKLLDLNHRLQNRVSDIADKQAAYETAGPLKRAGFYVRGHASGLTPAVHPKFEGSPEKAAGKQIKKAFSRLRNPTASKPAPKRSLPPLEPETPSNPQTPLKSSPSPIAGHPESDIDEVTRRGPGTDPEAAAARARQAEFLRTKRENLAGQRKEVPQKAADIRKQQEQGGHAGGGVSSVEELSRQGTNYVVTKSGKLTYHGKSFAPESTPSGATHVTVLPDGSVRVNAGEKLTPIQEKVLSEGSPVRRMAERPKTLPPLETKTNEVTVNVEGKDRTVTLSDEKMKEWDEAKKNYDSRIAYAERTYTGQELAARKKGYGMEYAAEKRKITGELTAKERQNKAAYEATNYKGKNVTVKGKPGTVIGTAFGRITVKLEDGSITRVDPSEIKPGLSPLK
jgi:hypothetical protein